MQPEILSSIPVITGQDDNYTVEDFIDYGISSCIDWHELPYKKKQNHQQLLQMSKVLTKHESFSRTHQFNQTYLKIDE